ncbi:protein phosphatase 2C domain-containing protein [Streptomyces sp. NPDC053493]|uniref:protein phosphatase 2C domain-containing protein n=1 Tax=Streptomyces sp. NPDC053493 TaxID=3365705 RepID=UPI0037D3F214
MEQQPEQQKTADGPAPAVPAQEAPPVEAAGEAVDDATAQDGPALPDRPAQPDGPAVLDRPAHPDGPAVPDRPEALPETAAALPDKPAALPETPAAQPDRPVALPETPAARQETPAAPPDRPAGPPVLGVPRHSGRKPPSYPPGPQGRPRVADGNASAVLPDTVLDGAAYGPLTVRAASVRGDSHRYLGEPRQDALTLAALGEPGAGELLMLAVADGVGSRRLSHVGAYLACQIAAWTLDPWAGEVYEALAAGRADRFAEVADQTVERIATRLQHTASTSGGDPAAYSTTLRVLLVPLDPGVRTRGLFTVGDGGTALLRDGRWDLAPGEPARPAREEADSGMIDTRTAALPLARTASARLLTTRPGDVLVLSTDGLSSPLAGEADMREFLGSAWGGGTVPEPADFLWQFQYRVKSYDDDRTAAVLWEALP